MKRIMRSKNKRTLQKRIRKLASTINFYSLLVMLSALMLLFGFIVSFLGTIISDNIAKQLREDIANIGPKAIIEQRTEGKFLIINHDSIHSNFNDISDYSELFRVLGRKYILAGKHHKALDNLEAVNLEISLEDKQALANNIENLNLIEYTFLKDQTVVYSSVDDVLNPAISKLKINRLMNFLSKEVEMPVRIGDDDAAFLLKVRINPALILSGYIALIIAGVIIFFITLGISQLFVRAFSCIIVKPLVDLEYKIDNLAEGKIEAAMTTEIVLKKPIREVENLANSTNKIISKMSEYVGLLENQKEELEAQNTTLAENSAELTSMNASLANHHSKLKNILDHVEQGLLNFNRNLLINAEYSLECERIFQKGIAYKRLSELFYCSDNNMQSFIDDLMLKIFDSEDSKRALYISLLPEEVLINERNISISYKIVTDEKNEEIMMVILSDITEKRRLEKMMDEERNTLKMVVKAIINRNEFLQLANEYNCFCNEDFAGLQNEDYDEVLRRIHTFKGNFSQFDMINVVKKLDELESKLYDRSLQYELNSINGNLLYSWLCEDMEIIEAYTGSNFLKDEEMFYIKKSKLTEIEDKIKKVLTPYECKTVLPLIKSLGYKSVNELLVTYPNYIDKLSQRLNKAVSPLEITGDEVLVDTSYYGDVSKALVHIFRNCVDHGVEGEDERLEKGKEQFGNIQCKIDDLGDTFSITISDDGRGIDVDLLEKKCIEGNIYSEEELKQLTYEEKLYLIFEQGITTKDSANSISGRGVGMAAVKEAVEKSGGTIEVFSVKDQYTSFVITLPKIEETTEDTVTPQKFMDKLLKTTKSIISEQTGITLESGEVKQENIISLNKVTSLVNLKGSINSIVMLSANEAMARSLVEGFIIEEISEEEKAIYAEDVLGEICNSILGNTFGLFEDNSDVFQISIPAMISNKGAYLKYTNSDILTCSLEYKDFKLSINMLLLHEDSQEYLRGI